MNHCPTTKEIILGGLWGTLVGDALGVPVEFRDRASLLQDPVGDMRGYGTYRQPPGTWSDDGALTLCTLESLVHCEFSTQDMGQRFLQWIHGGRWTATGEVFDVGLATSAALRRIADGVPAEEAGGRGEESNGNGSLMRILPVALRVAGGSSAAAVDTLSRASAITHGHERSRMACGFHGLLVRHLMQGRSPQGALDATRAEFTRLFGRSEELPCFRRVLQDDFVRLGEGEVASTGYVLHTLHASLWCLLTTTGYAECVLKAVNLGGDTDTTGCVAGGLAGVHYGLAGIPTRWRCGLARHDEVQTLLERFATLAAGGT